MNRVYQLIEKIRNAKEERRRIVALWVALSIIVSGSVSWSMHGVGSTITKEKICGHEEHQHTEECYQEILACGINIDGHIHNDSCYSRVLVCGLDEHIHNARCSDNIGVDKENDDIWLSTLPEDLSADWRKNIVRIAESQSGYTESSDNFIFSDDGETKKGYTRYGDWYGNPYGDWNTMFTYFCMNYAGITENDIVYGSGCWAWSEKLIENELLLLPDEYIPVSGDIVFLDMDNDNHADRTGIINSVSEADENGNNVLVTVIEGDFENSVAETSYFIDDERIFGYLSLENTNMPEQSFDGVTESGIKVHVDAMQGAFLSETIMQVSDIEYEEALNVISETENNSDIVSAVAVDISFFDKNGNKVEPSDGADVNVSISLPDDRNVDGEEFYLYHQKDSGEVEVISEADVSADGASFSADGFSPFIISGVQLDSSLKTAGENTNLLYFNGVQNNSSESNPYIVYPGDTITVSVELNRLSGDQFGKPENKERLKAYYTHTNNRGSAPGDTIGEWQTWDGNTYDNNNNLNRYCSPANIYLIINNEFYSGISQYIFTKDWQPVTYKITYTVPSIPGDYAITYNNCGNYKNDKNENICENLYFRVGSIKVQGDSSGKDYSSSDNPYILKVGDRINLIGYSGNETNSTIHFETADCNASGYFNQSSVTNNNATYQKSNIQNGNRTLQVTAVQEGYIVINLFYNTGYAGLLGEFYIKVVPTYYSYSTNKGATWVNNATTEQNPVELTVGNEIWIRRNGTTQWFSLPGNGSNGNERLNINGDPDETGGQLVRKFVAVRTGNSNTDIINGEGVYMRVSQNPYSYSLDGGETWINNDTDVNNRIILKLGDEIMIRRNGSTNSFSLGGQTSPILSPDSKDPWSNNGELVRKFRANIVGDSNTDVIDKEAVYVKVVQTYYSYSTDKGATWVNNATTEQNPVELTVGNEIWIRRNGTTKWFSLPGNGSNGNERLNISGDPDETGGQLVRKFVAVRPGNSSTEAINGEVLNITVKEIERQLYVAAPVPEAENNHNTKETAYEMMIGDTITLVGEYENANLWADHLKNIDGNSNLEKVTPKGTSKTENIGNGKTRITKTYTAINEGYCCIWLEDSTDNTKNRVEPFYIHIRNESPIMIYTATGWRNKDRIHEAMNGEGGNGYGGMYWKNSRNEYYLVHPTDWIYISNDTGNVDLSNFTLTCDFGTSSLDNTNMSIVNYEGKKALKIQMPDTIPENSIYILTYTSGSYTENFYFKLTNESVWQNAYYDHADIEIADGGTYIIYTEYENEKGETVRVTRTYDAYIDNIDHCQVNMKNNNSGNITMATEDPGALTRQNYITIGKFEYWRHNEPGDTQYELTSKYMTETGTQNKIPESGGNDRRRFYQNNTAGADFYVDVHLKPRSETVTINNVPKEHDDSDFRNSASTIVHNARIPLEQQSVIDANNKCPDHSGLDFTVTAETVTNTLRSGGATVQIKKQYVKSTDKSQKLGMKAGQFTFELYELKKDNNNNYIIENGRPKRKSNTPIDSNAVNTAADDGTEGYVFFDSLFYIDLDLNSTDTTEVFYYEIVEKHNPTNTGIKFDDRSQVVKVTATPDEHYIKKYNTSVEYVGNTLDSKLFTTITVNGTQIRVPLFTNELMFYELPSTGGMGKDVLIFVGTGLMLTSITIYKKRRRKGDE